MADDGRIGLGGLLSATLAGGAPASGVTYVASRARVSAAKALAAPAATAAQLNTLDLSLVYAAMAGVTILAALTTLSPIIGYITNGWKWRAALISKCLGTKAKDLYLTLFQREPSDECTAPARFDRYYRRWYGRWRLVLPALLV